MEAWRLDYASVSLAAKVAPFPATKHGAQWQERASTLESVEQRKIGIQARGSMVGIRQIGKHSDGWKASVTADVNSHELFGEISDWN